MATKTAIQRQDRTPGQYSIAKARDRLPALVHQAEAGNPIELTRRGVPVAIIVGLQDYQRLARRQSTFWSAYEQFRLSAKLAQLNIGAGVFEGVRDRSPGREPSC